MCLGYQPIPGLGLLMIDLDANKVGSLMHRTHIDPPRFLVRRDLHGTGQNFFLYLGSLVSGLPSASPRGRRPQLIPSCLVPRAAQKVLVVAWAGLPG